MISQPARLVSDLLAANAGSVNAFMKRFGPEVVDYATALIPARDGAFEPLVEDILVDALAQIRAAETGSDEALRRFVLECACRTLRARHKEVLAQGPDPRSLKTSYRHGEVLSELNMSEAQLAAAVSEGVIRAFREDDTTKFRAEDLRALMKRQSGSLACISAAERELICLQFRLGIEPEVIARWTGLSPAEVEDRTEGACRALVRAGVLSESLG